MCAGQKPCPDISVYCASKAALTHFAACVALEEAEKGIRVNTLSPGIVLTENHIKSQGQEVNDKGYVKKAQRESWMLPLI